MESGKEGIIVALATENKPTEAKTVPSKKDDTSDSKAIPQ
jgi:hypothetical protein